MLTAIADLAVRHPRRMLGAALAAFAVAVVVGVLGLSGLNARNPFVDPGSASFRAQQQIARVTGREASPGVVALVAAPPGSPEVVSAARSIAAVPGVANVVAPAPGLTGGLVSRDGRSSLIVATLASAPDPAKVVAGVERATAGRHDVRLGGTDTTVVQAQKQAQKDLEFGEALAFPILAALAFVIFRGIAALLPITVAALAVPCTFLVLRTVNIVLPLSVFALNLVIGMGLGLAIDYCLFLVWRFREEAAERTDVGDAVRATVASTGRTVLFSAATVAAAMVSLALFPQRLLVSMALGGAVVALVSAGSALLIVPPLLVLLHARIGKRSAGRQGDAWYRLAHWVMRHAGLVAAGTAAFLLVLAAPALSVRWSGVDATVLPKTVSARVVADTIASDFPPTVTASPITVVAAAGGHAGPELSGYADRLARLPGVGAASAPVRVGEGTWVIQVSGREPPVSGAGQRTVEAVRATPAPVPVLVGGLAATFADQGAAIVRTLPAALVVLAAVTLTVLWLMTASVILPIKALLMNALTAAATTGLLVFVFQDGRFTGPLGYTSQGGIEETDFLILAALAFALSTDYGVFLLARIMEARRPGRPDREAIAVGMQRTGRLITLAAILLAAAVGVFATSKLVFLKEVGIGVAAAVLIDAFIVRTFLVPSLMALLGRWNWWQPAWLARLHPGPPRAAAGTARGQPIGPGRQGPTPLSPP